MVTATTTVDIATVLEGLLAEVDGLRVYRYVADNFRPPGAVIAMPAKVYDDPAAGFCATSWEFPVSVVVSRNQDRAAQDALARMETEVARVLEAAEPDDVMTVAVVRSDPATVNVSGVDCPAYNMRVRIRA